MFVRSTYFPHVAISSNIIVYVILDKVKDDRLADDHFVLYIHHTGNKTVLVSEPICEDPDHIMRTITAELNGVEPRAAVARQCMIIMEGKDKEWLLAVLKLRER